MNREFKLPIPVSTLIFCLVCFAAPIIGGQVSTETNPFSGSVLSELMGGAALPLLTRCFLSIPILLIGLGLLYKNKVFQIPTLNILGGVALAVSLLFLASFSAEFAQNGIAQSVGWAVYVAAFLISVACAGRKVGPAWIIGSVAAGCSRPRSLGCTIMSPPKIPDRYKQENLPALPPPLRTFVDAVPAEGAAD